VNCVPNSRECGGKGGCHGATVELALDYVRENGLSDERQTPYVGADRACHRSSMSRKVAGFLETRPESPIGLFGHTILTSNSVKPFMTALMAGPVSASVAAKGWRLYNSGIFDSCSRDAIISHAVLAVGYGIDGAHNYWHIQNSWSSGWGEKGYIRVLRHSGSEDDTFCGVDVEPEKGIECKPYPSTVKVCGMCGILYDSVVPHF